MNAFELFNERGQPTGVWCCGNCRSLPLNPDYRAGGQEPRTTQAGAEACCRPRLCAVCGDELPKGSYRSEDLCDRHSSEKQRREYEERQAQALEKATLVLDYTGPIYCESHSGDWGDHYHSTIDYLTEVIMDSEWIFDEHGNLDPDSIPEFAFCCTKECKGLDLGQILEHLCDDGYEGMETCLETSDALKTAIDEFNTTNEKALTVYNQDGKHKVVLRDYVLAAIMSALPKESFHENPLS